jgi:C4-dicarboxylate-specific signal transduction histidine kinase
VIARIRALFNKEQPREELLDVNDIIRRVLELARGAVERQRVMVRTQLAEPAAMVMADPVQLQQVLVNLVTNALEAMASTNGRPQILTVCSAVEAGETVDVTVEDTGSGLEPEQVAHVFDSFYTTKAGGVGLGLAISRSIIEAHRGSIWAAPGTDDGARIGFSLPMAKQQAENRPSTARSTRKR